MMIHNKTSESTTLITHTISLSLSFLLLSFHHSPLPPSAFLFHPLHCPLSLPPSLSSSTLPSLSLSFSPSLLPFLLLPFPPFLSLSPSLSLPHVSLSLPM